MAKLFQAYIILSQYVTKVCPLVARFAPQLPPPAASVDLESEAFTVQDSQNYLAWKKVIVAFCLGSSIEIATLFAEMRPAPLPITFNFLSLAILLAFTSLCVGKCYSKHQFHRMARMLEQVGGFFTVTAFFIAIAIPFPLWLQWCTGAVYAISFLSIIIWNLFWFP